MMSEGMGKKRNWKRENEKIVRRGETYANVEWINNWEKEIEEMNKNKRGRPYEYPQTLILFGAYVYVGLGLSFRELEGFLRKILGITGRQCPDYTVLFRRIRELKPDVEKTPKDYNGRDVIISVDATGVKVTNRGEWMRKVYKRERKGWVKMNVAVDTETKQFTSVAVTEERVADTKMFREIVGKAKENTELNGKGKVIQVNADGGYDSNMNFEFAEELGILPVIKVRAPEKISVRSKNPRKKYGKMIKEWGYEKWREIFGYGKRWIVESVFSAFKRRFGESVRAKKKANIFQEVKLKCMVYNFIVRYDLTGILPWA